MTANKFLYRMQSVIDSSVIKTLWAESLNEVEEKIGVCYNILTISAPTPHLVRLFDEHVIYCTPRNFKYRIGDRVPYRGDVYTILQKRVENDREYYRLEEKITSQMFI